MSQVRRRLRTQGETTLAAALRSDATLGKIQLKTNIYLCVAIMAFQALNHSTSAIPQEILDAFSDQPKLKDQISWFICMFSTLRKSVN